MTTAQVRAVLRRGIRIGLGGLVPYTLVAAACFWALAVIGGAVGVGNGTSTVIPIRPADAAIVDRNVGYFLRHNVPIALKLVFGAVTLGLLTVYIVAVNGFLLGSVFVEAAAVHGRVTALALLLPHGIFELPALWLSAAVGFRWVHALWRVTRSSRAGGGIAALLLQTAVGTGTALLLLVVAAVIEANVTVTVARLVGG